MTGNEEEWDATKEMPVCRIAITPLARQSQSLQLCALMTINNLLQLVPDKKRGVIQREETTENLILCGRKLFYHDALPFATKLELDTIADDLIIREATLLSCDGENSLLQRGGQATGAGTSTGRERKVSYWKLFQSHHRTPFAGNYSFEVLEAALQMRNVKLDWVTDFGNKRLNDIDDDGNSVVVGFVINSVEPLSIKNAIMNLFGTPRHWWTITRVRRVGSVETKAQTGLQTVETRSALFVDSESGCELGYDCDEWNVIDSLSEITQTLSFDDLKEFLGGIHSEKGSILRATMINTDEAKF